MKSTLVAFGKLIFWIACAGIFILYFTLPQEKDLWKAYKTADPDVPGQFEQEMLQSRVLKRCKVGGKYTAFFGHVDYKTTFQFGRPRPNPEPQRLFVWSVFYPDKVGVLFRGYSHVHEIFPEMKRQGCEPPPLNTLSDLIESD